MSRLNYKLRVAESTNAFKVDGKYNEALKLLKTIIVHDKTAKEIFPIIQKAKCEIEKRSYSDAETTCKKIATLIESEEFENKNNETKQKCLVELDSLVMKLIEIKQVDIALLIAESQFHLIKHSYSVQEKLKKLEDLGVSLMNISKNFQNEHNSWKAKQIYFLADEILSDMKHVVAKLDKLQLSKNKFFIDFNLFTKTNFPQKKIVLIFNQFLVINSLICRI